MAKVCTDIEQSKRLVELGLDTNTADMFWMKDFPTRNDWESVTTPYKDCGDENAIPAWSLSALLELIGTYTMQTTIEGMVFIVGEGELYISNNHSESIDAAYELIVWLLKK